MGKASYKATGVSKDERNFFRYVIKTINISIIVLWVLFILISITPFNITIIDKLFEIITYGQFFMTIFIVTIFGLGINLVLNVTTQLGK